MTDEKKPEEPTTAIPVPGVNPLVEMPLTPEELRRRMMQADFQLGAASQHLRLPMGLPKNR